MSSLKKNKRIANLCPEVGISHNIPIYSGGLGLLNGDMLKGAADLGIPIDGYSLLYRKGNYKQVLAEDGWQSEEDILWNPLEYITKLDKKVQIKIYDRNINLNAWRCDIKGVKSTVPIYLLDAYDRENPQNIRESTDKIYDRDRNRIYQEAILGIGAVKLGKELGIEYGKYHMNEGHSAFLIFELMKQDKSLEEIIDKCVFTTHTPVEAGLEKFNYGDIGDIFRELVPANIKKLAGDDQLNMTLLALNCSGYANAVSKKHGDIANEMFDRKFKINYITNGVHSETWASESFKRLYDKYCKGWRGNAELLKNAKDIPLENIWDAHNTEKRKMMDLIYRLTGTDLNPELLTIGIARRVAKYKRLDLIFDNINELRRIGKGRMQIIFSGKAHPSDWPAKETIKNIFRSIKEIGNDVKCVYVPNYNMYLGQVLTSGCDVWLNNPLPPNEASGTSGMCAAVNAVPQISTLDGWWCEGWKEDVTGWSIGRECNNLHPIHPDSPEAYEIRKEDAASLYEKNENKIMPMYYGNRKKFIEIMRNDVAIIASYFNTHRVMKELAEKAYKTRINDL